MGKVILAFSSKGLERNGQTRGIEGVMERIGESLDIQN